MIAPDEYDEARFDSGTVAPSTDAFLYGATAFVLDIEEYVLSAGRWFRKRLAVIGGGVAIVLALSVLLVGQQSPAAAVGPDLLGVTVSNDSGRGEPVYLYVLGTDILPGSGRGYVNAAGTFTRWPAGGTHRSRHLTSR